MANTRIKTKKTLATRRAQTGLKQDDLAAAVGITREYYNAIENGRRSPGGQLAHAIAFVLGADPDELFRFIR